jgi:hypothetical protein
MASANLLWEKIIDCWLTSDWYREKYCRMVDW